MLDFMAQKYNIIFQENKEDNQKLCYKNDLIKSHFHSQCFEKKKDLKYADYNLKVFNN